MKNGKAFCLAVFLAFSLAVPVFSSPVEAAPSREKNFGTFYQEMLEGKISRVQISGQVIEGADQQNYPFKTIIPLDNQYDLAKELKNHGVIVEFKEPSDYGWLRTILFSFLMMLFVFFLIGFLLKKVGKNAGGDLISFGKSRAKLSSESKREKVTFQDVAGIDEAKEELQEIIEFLKKPAKFKKLGGRIPRGVLLVGPPGTGKTLLAKAVAGEADVPFLSTSGSEFSEMYVGVGASRVRNLFTEAQKKAPAIVFIDEIDAAGRRRSAETRGGGQEYENTLNQILVEMDGFETNNGIIIIAASNRPDILDPALLRPGRFDRQVVVPLPDLKGREAILRVHAKNKPLDNKVDLVAIAKGTSGFSGADLANLINEAALLATRFDHSQISAEDFEEAQDKVSMGKARKSMLISDQQKINTAYHEVGHALVAYMIPGADPLHKITIIPRGLALGLTQQRPEEDRYNYTRQDGETRIAIFMGGRCAEQLALHIATSGCSNDFEQATKLANKMVTKWGMSEKLSPRVFASTPEESFNEIGHGPQVAQLIDEEIDILLKNGYNQAQNILEAHRPKLEKLVQALLEQETLNLDQITAILGSRPAKL